MGSVRTHRPVLCFLAAFSRHIDALDWARRKTAEAWGPIALASPILPFTETAFYEASMGPSLQIQLLGFEQLIDPAALVARKHEANAWEVEFRDSHPFDEPRPLNLDPGYVSEAKLILASTKDRDHRIYLDQGIFAEGTLYFQKGQWQSRPWTYPNYRRNDYQQFLTACRDYLRDRYRREKVAGSQ